jgi:hypothetical protein
MKRVYVGMGLTHAPESYRTRFHDMLKNALERELNIEMLEFEGIEEGDAVDEYTHDKASTELACLDVFIVDFPSTCLGMDIAFRLLTGKPMLILAHSKTIVARRITGMCVSQQVPMYRYNSIAEIVEEVQGTLNTRT